MPSWLLVSSTDHVREPDRASFVEVNRTRLRVWEWGDPGSPPVICAHGAYDHGRMFDGIASWLADDGYRVLAPDLRGHGDSGGVANGHIFYPSAIDLGVLALTQEVPVGLVGHSMGSSILLNVAATWPEIVRWMVSLDNLGPSQVAIAEMAMESVVAGSVTGLARRQGRDRRVFDDVESLAAQRSRVNTRMPSEWLDHLARHGSRSTADGVVWKWAPLMNPDLPEGFGESWVTADLGAVQCHTLALMGDAEEDWSLPSAEVPERASHVSKVEYHVVADAGHYVHLEQPDVVIGLIRAFLGRVDS